MNPVELYRSMTEHRELLENATHLHTAIQALEAAERVIQRTRVHSDQQRQQELGRLDRIQAMVDQIKEERTKLVEKANEIEADVRDVVNRLESVDPCAGALGGKSRPVT